MVSKPPVDVVLGTHSIGDATLIPGFIHFDKKEDVAAVLDAFRSRDYSQIDTARNYSGSEARLGAAGAPGRFTIHTKILGMGNGTHSPGQIADSINASLQDLGVSSVETVFLHVPDRETPFEDTARAMHEAWEQGKFKRFGLSNYTAAEVADFLKICNKHGWVKPSVYQGHYNAIVRGAEKALFPLLRENGMSFFAYSPAAGGFFTGNSDKKFRWAKDNPVGQLYSGLYASPAVRASIETVQTVAAKHEIDGHSAALRWTRFHSALASDHGDALVFAVSRMDQLEKSLNALDAGPLPQEVADAISAIYGTYEGEGEPSYHL